uniref:Transmembrane protein 198 n=1 Tax=Geotrypetes seraphini TaxID=260995 RepID=A0A6P8Q6S2_GEOSA|nr:transmembrane protein 198-like isoform X1 [Geotrypetes seraphini]
MESDLSPFILTSDPRHYNLQSVESGGEEILQSHCSLELERHYDLIPSIVCALCCFFGIIYNFFGYRCFKAIMFLSGLLFGSAVIFLLCYKERILDTQLSLEVSAGIALGIGVLCGLVTMLVRSVGLFMTGLLLGLLLASATLIVMEQFYHPHTVWVPIGFLMGLAMLFAVLTLQWQKLFTVISTAAFGAAIMVVCVDYFIELLTLAHYLYDRIRVARSEPLCWYSWVILGVWPVLSILGIVVQWRITAEGFSHTDVILSHRQKRLQLLRIRQQEVKKRQSSVPQDSSCRRKANPPKRYTGDILAPSYIQSLRERQTVTGTSLSSLGTNIQSIIDLDYDTGSTVPLTATAPTLRA